MRNLVLKGEKANEKFVYLHLLVNKILSKPK